MALIETAIKQSVEQEEAMMQAIHAALMESFKVKDHAVNVRLINYELHRFLVPKNCNPECYVIISIDCFSCRSLAAKQNLYTAIVDNLSAFNIPKDHVKIVLRESSRENWGIHGGFAGCDVDVGYKINI